MLNSPWNHPSFSGWFEWQITTIADQIATQLNTPATSNWAQADSVEDENWDSDSFGTLKITLILDEALDDYSLSADDQRGIINKINTELARRTILPQVSKITIQRQSRNIALEVEYCIGSV